jgi:hypothetical protein
MLLSSFAYSSTLNVEAACSSETSVDFSTDCTALYTTRELSTYWVIHFQQTASSAVGVAIINCTCIQEVPGSILGQDIGYLDRNLSSFSSELLDKRWDSTPI